MIEPRKPNNLETEERIGRILNEFHDRRARGESVSEAELLAAHPDLAEELKPFLGTLGELRSAGGNVKRILANGTLTENGDVPIEMELGEYKTLGFLGRGGMGLVLKAHEERLNRTVALKILRPELTDNEASRKRFTREAQAIGMIRHPNIVTVYGVGSHEGMPYLSMEYIDGPTLADLIRDEGPLEATLARRIFREILCGLSAAHAKELIHRDIKSANILLDGPEQQAKITDFGLARLMSSETRITLPESTPGTPEYMSPEQARGDESIDIRTDLYSAGVVLYEILTGRPPFRAEAPTAVVHQILNDHPVDPLERNPQADPQLASLAMRLLAKRPEDRLASVDEVLSAIDEGEHVESPEHRRRMRRQVLRVITLACALFGGVWLAGRALNASHDSWRSPDAPKIINSVHIYEDDADRDTLVVARFGSDPADRVIHDFGPGDTQTQCATLIDAQGNGNKWVVVGTKNQPEGCNLIILSALGEILHKHNLSFDMQWPDCSPPTQWTCPSVAAGDLNGQPGDELVVVGCDTFEYPTRISIMDPRTWTIQTSFWHMGQISEIRILPDYFGKDTPAILAWGSNNKLDGFDQPQPGNTPPFTNYERVQVAMILDPRKMDGLGPPNTNRIDIPPVMPYAYAYFDLVADPNLQSRLDPPGTLPPRPRLEVACMQEIRIGPYEVSDGTEPWFVAPITEGGDSRTAEDLALLTFDRHLRLRNVLISLESEQGRTNEYWDKHWRPLIQEYEYVQPIAAEPTPKAINENRDA